MLASRLRLTTFERMTRYWLSATVAIATLQPVLAGAQTAYDRTDASPVEAAGVKRLAESILGPGNDVYLVPVESPSGGVLPRWRTGEDGSPRTVTIYFENPEDPVRFGRGYRWAVNQALSQWASIPGVALRFQEAAGRGTAQVIVKWVTQMSTAHSGLTAWETDQNGWIASAVVTLTLLRRDGQPVGRHLARRIALHEVGHLVGLGHSEDAGDMMFPTSERSRLSPRDRATAKLLYAVEPWVLLEPGP
jgi:hypothetical protein